MAATLVLSACEKQIDIDIESQQSQVVMVAQGETGSPLYVRLTYSRPVFGTFYVPYGEGYFKEIDDAVVSLTVNGAPVGTVVNYGGNYTIGGYLPQAGDQLSLRVDIPGRAPITADATVPQVPVVEDVMASTQDESYSYVGMVRFALVDAAGTEDYYSVRVRSIDTVYYTKRLNATDSVVAYDTTMQDYPVDFRCVDYAIIVNTGIDVIDPEDPEAANTYYGDEMLFTDANINGQRHDFKLDVTYGGYMERDGMHYGDETYYWRIEEIRKSYVLEVSALSRDVYLYRQSLEAYDDDVLLSFFTEPVQIHSNVDGCIGFFGVSSKTVKHIVLDD